jgi:hypothetical protein
MYIYVHLRNITLLYVTCTCDSARKIASFWVIFLWVRICSHRRSRSRENSSDLQGAVFSRLNLRWNKKHWESLLCCRCSGSCNFGWTVSWSLHDFMSTSMKQYENKCHLRKVRGTESFRARKRKARKLIWSGDSCAGVVSLCVVLCHLLAPPSPVSACKTQSVPKKSCFKIKLHNHLAYRAISSLASLSAYLLPWSLF